MRSASEMNEISNDTIRKQNEVNNEILEKIDNYLSWETKKYAYLDFDFR